MEVETAAKISGKKKKKRRNQYIKTEVKVWNLSGKKIDWDGEWLFKFLKESVDFNWDTQCMDGKN